MKILFSLLSLLLAAVLLHGCSSKPATTAEVNTSEVSLQTQRDSSYQLTFADLQVAVAQKREFFHIA